MQRDELLGRHVGEQLPQRLALDLGPQVPDGVDHRAGRQVDDALLGPDPAQLLGISERRPEGAEIGVSDFEASDR